MNNMYGSELPEQSSWAHTLIAYIRPAKLGEEIPFAVMLLLWGLLILAPALWGATVYTGAISMLGVVLFITWSACALTPIPTSRD